MEVEIIWAFGANLNDAANNAGIVEPITEFERPTRVPAVKAINRLAEAGALSGDGYAAIEASYIETKKYKEDNGMKRARGVVYVFAK